jgi:hypothetical protein
VAGAAEAKPGGTTDDEPPIKAADDPDKKLSEVLTKFDTRLTSIEQTIAELKAGKTTTDDNPDGTGAVVDPATTEDGNPDADDKDGQGSVATGDSAALRDEFQQTKMLAEILAPGLSHPTYDSKITVKKTQDAMCALRRRALKAALDGEHGDLVKSVTGNADVSKLTCDSARMAFQAAATLVKQANTRVADHSAASTHHNPAQAKDLNAVHREFWSNRM